MTGDPHTAAAQRASRLTPVRARLAGNRLALLLITGLGAHLVATGLVSVGAYQLSDDIAALHLGQRIADTMREQDQPARPLELTAEATCTTAGQWAAQWTLASRAEHLRYRIERRTVSPGGTVTGLHPGTTIAPAATLTGRYLPPPGSTRAAMTVVVQPAVGSVAAEKTLIASVAAPSCATP